MITEVKQSFHHLQKVSARCILVGRLKTLCFIFSYRRFLFYVILGYVTLQNISVGADYSQPVSSEAHKSNKCLKLQESGGGGGGVQLAREPKSAVLF